MRRLAFIGIVAALGYSAYSSTPPTPVEPVIITPVVIEPETAVAEPETGATDVTAAKAEVESLTWQLDVIKEQLEKAQSEVASGRESKPEPVYRSAPSGHYEWRRSGLFRRKKIWVAD